MYSTFCRIKIEKKYVNWNTYLLYCPIVVEVDALYIVQWSPSYVVLEKNKKKEKRMSMYVISLWILVLTAGVVSLLLFEMFYIIIEQQIVSKWCKNGFC